MGKARYIYFNDEISEKLDKENNKSELINQLLRNYYKEKEFEDMSEEQIKTEISIIDLQEKTEKKIKEMRNG